jgi:hypothetical protein
MKINKTYYKSFDNFLLRTPILSLDYIQSVFSKEDTSVETIQEICKSDIISEAIFLASPIFHEQLMKWLNNELSVQKDIDQLIYTITKYLMRMGSRCTPFGLFAGYSLGKIGDQSNIELEKSNCYYGHLRLDMNYLCSLAMDLAKIPEIKKQIKYYSNSSIYNSGDNLRYVEYQYINSHRTHFIVGIENSEYVAQILQVAENGASIKEFANLLVDEEISLQEAESFIDELIESQLLISELEPSVTGLEFLDQIINTLKPLNNIDEVLKYLYEIKSDIQSICDQSIGIPVNNYKEITNKLSNLNTKYDLKYLFQTDMVLSTKENELSKNVRDDVIKGIEILNRLTPSWSNIDLSNFKEAFYERYEEREVLLSKVLDIESGIGYIQNKGSGDISPLVDDLNLPFTSGQNEINLKWNSIQSFLLKKYTEAISKGLKEIEIFDDEVKDFQLNWNDLPSTISAMVEIIEASDNEESNSVIYLNSAGGSSAANLLGRFCHSDNSLFKYVKNITEKEQNSNEDIVFAEIVHLPESRTGNILLRPQLREYEIPYLAKASVSKEKQVSLDDLYISVKQGRKIVLRSKSLNKEIVPRLSTAHNYSNNALPIYQFLCDLQTQDLRGGVSFNWGSLVGEFSFFPRVKYQNIILSKATWNIKKEDIDDLIKLKSNKEIEDKAKAWKEKFKLPDYVLLADGDNELLLNLNNLLCIKTLLSLVKKRPGFQLKEFLFNAEKALVKRGEESFTNQVIFSFYKSQTHMPDGHVDNN